MTELDEVAVSILDRCWKTYLPMDGKQATDLAHHMLKDYMEPHQIGVMAQLLALHANHRYTPPTEFDQVLELALHWRAPEDEFMCCILLDLYSEKLISRNTYLTCRGRVVDFVNFLSSGQVSSLASALIEAKVPALSRVRRDERGRHRIDDLTALTTQLYVWWIFDLRRTPRKVHP